MSIQEFIEAIENEFDELEKGTLTPSFSIRNMDGWSSMHALLLIALVDNHYELLLTGEDLRSIQTVQELYDLIQIKTKVG
jgi:acyl carrier protein